MSQSKRVLYISCAALALTAASGGWVLADDFVVDTPSIQTNDGNTLGTGDSITITETGSIAPGAGDPGVLATVNAIIVVNSGSIAASGEDAYGIELVNGNTVTNSGLITTSNGENGVGILVVNNNVITNFGMITTSGVTSWGIGVGDDSTISNYGAITTSGRRSHGISTLDGNVITNFGLITVTGSSSWAIQVRDGSQIFNYGSISTIGSSGAINGASQNTITNFGSISTIGSGGAAISAEDANTIINAGMITTNGLNTEGIEADDNNVITNSGSISTSGRGAHAILADDNNVITNSGMITTRGDFSSGIEGGEAPSGNTIINTGTITTTGSSAAAIAIGDSTIINSGRLVSAQSESVRLATGSTNVLNLLAPSFLGGRIDLGTNTTVNIVSGPSHSILWDLSTGTMDGGAPTLSGPVPIFYNAATQQVATFDPTALSGSANALGDMTGNLSALMRQRLSASQAGGGDAADASFVSAYAASPEQSGNAAIDRITTAFQDSSGADTGWWVSGFGSYADYDGNAAALDHGFDHVGVAAGYDWQHSADLTLGAMVGYGMGSFDADSRFANAFDNSADGAFAAFYGRADLAHSMFVDFALSGGLLSHSDSRFVNDNLAPLGVSSASADYDSWWLAPEMTLGMEFNDVMGSQWSYIPSASLRYAMQSVEGYTETGPSAANATVSARDVAVLETRLEFAARRDFELATLSGHVVGRLGWQHRAAMGDDAVAITMIGQNNSVSTFSQDGSAAYLGLDASMDVGDTASLALGAEYRLGDSVQAMRGMATLTVAF